MSSFLVVILALVANLIPANVDECSVTMSGKEMRFIKKGENWEIEKLYKNKDKTAIIKTKSIGSYKVKDLDITMKNGDKEHTFSTKNSLGVSSVKELKSLSKIKMLNETFDITKTDTSIVLKNKDKVFVEVSWENKTK